jgi:hypothetical protein
MQWRQINKQASTGGPARANGWQPEKVLSSHGVLWVNRVGCGSEGSGRTAANKGDAGSSQGKGCKQTALGTDGAGRT